MELLIQVRVCFPFSVNNAFVIEVVCWSDNYETRNMISHCYLLKRSGTFFLFKKNIAFVTKLR